MDATKLQADAALLKARFTNDWGAFRRFLSAHPLTCFWGSLALGLAVGHFV